MDFEDKLTAMFEGKEPHKFSCVMALLPSDITREMLQFGESIDKDDLAEDGLEDEPHVTVKFGLHTSVPGELEKLLDGEGPIELILGKMSLFKASDDKQFDVLKIGVHSPDLHRLNKKISTNMRCTDTHPTYKPHATIGYLKPGKAEQYIDDRFEGRQITISSVLFSSKTRKKTDIPLKGKTD